jgi:hypothetical protein
MNADRDPGRSSHWGGGKNLRGSLTYLREARL